MQDIRDPNKIEIDYLDFLVYPYVGIVKSKETKKIYNVKNSHGYIKFKFKQVNYASHRLIYEAFHNIKLEKSQHINHINHVRDDNRIENLELVSNQQNTQWGRPRTGNHKGAVWCEPKKKWRAELKYNYKNYFLGYYESEIEAAKAYNAFAQHLNETKDCKYMLNEINEENYMCIGMTQDCIKKKEYML